MYLPRSILSVLIIRVQVFCSIWKPFVVFHSSASSHESSRLPGLQETYLVYSLAKHTVYAFSSKPFNFFSLSFLLRINGVRGCVGDTGFSDQESKCSATDCVCAQRCAKNCGYKRKSLGCAFKIEDRKYTRLSAMSSC